MRLHILYKTFILLTVCYSYTYSMTYSSGFVIIIQDSTTFSVIRWHQMDTRLGLDPACIGDPACIRSFTVTHLIDLQCTVALSPTSPNKKTIQIHANPKTHLRRGRVDICQTLASQ